MESFKFYIKNTEIVKINNNINKKKIFVEKKIKIKFKKKIKIKRYNSNYLLFKKKKIKIINFKKSIKKNKSKIIIIKNRDNFKRNNIFFFISMLTKNIKKAINVIKKYEKKKVKINIGLLTKGN